MFKKLLITTLLLSTSFSVEAKWGDPNEDLNAIQKAFSTREQITDGLDYAGNLVMSTGTDNFEALLRKRPTKYHKKIADNGSTFFAYTTSLSYALVDLPKDERNARKYLLAGKKYALKACKGGLENGCEFAKLIEEDLKALK